MKSYSPEWPSRSLSPTWWGRVFLRRSVFRWRRSIQPRSFFYCGQRWAVRCLRCHVPCCLARIIQPLVVNITFVSADSPVYWLSWCRISDGGLCRANRSGSLTFGVYLATAFPAIPVLSATAVIVAGWSCTHADPARICLGAVLPQRYQSRS